MGEILLVEIGEERNLTENVDGSGHRAG
jgi:hypothetical protein